MRRQQTNALIGLLLLSLAEPAFAQEACQTDRAGRPDGPLAIGLLDGRLGLARSACPRSEVLALGDAYLVADLANFYGHIRVDAALGGSWAISDRTEVFALFEVYRWQTVISTIDATYHGTGYLSLGAVQQVWRGRGLALAVSGRLVLPTTSGLDQSSSPLALDVGVTADWAAHRTVNVYGALLLAGSLGLSAGPAVPRGTVRLLAGMDWHPLTWLGIVLEVNAGFGYRDALDHLAVSLGFRFAIGDNFGIELAAMYPFVGAERALLTGVLQLSWRFGTPSRGIAEPVAPCKIP